MFRLPQIVRNSFIRLEGLLYQFFGLIGKLLGWFNQLFQSLSKLFGFDKTQYFLENEAQAGKLSETKPNIPESSTPQNSSTNTSRRRPDASMDYFLKMTRQEKKSS